MIAMATPPPLRARHALPRRTAVAWTALSAVFFAVSASAATRWKPFGFGLGGDKGSLPTFDTAVYGLRLGVFASNCEMYGLSVAILGSGTNGDGDAAGVQIAGAANSAASARFGLWQLSGLGNGIDGDALGIQLTGVVNIVDQGDMSGVQVAGGANRVGGKMNGLQIAGAFNGGDHDVNGLQIAGLMNIDKARMCGVQIGGVGNSVDNDADGLQLSALGNMVLGNANGVQIAGGFNIVEGHVNGVQIGLLNMAQSLTGVQIGLLNVAGNSALPILHICF